MPKIRLIFAKPNDNTTLQKYSVCERGQVLIFTALLTGSTLLFSPHLESFLHDEVYSRDNHQFLNFSCFFFLRRARLQPDTSFFFFLCPLSTL